MSSIWSETVSFKSYPKLNKEIKTDVVIVGGGIAGILTARKLKDKGVDCVLIEADRICKGVTQNTTAKLTFQHGLIYGKIIKTYGKEKAQMYLEANKKALEEYEHISKTVSCDFEKRDSYLYTLSDIEALEDELDALSKIGYKASITRDLPLPFNVEGALKFSSQAQFNPLKFLKDISKGLTIYENTKAMEFSKNTVVTNGGKIYASKIVIATHFPIINKHGAYFMKMYQERSYAIAIKTDDNINGIYLDEAEKGMSFRNYKDYLIVGGGDHRTGKNGSCYDGLISYANKYYKNEKIISKWATQDCMTLDGIPYIGRYGRNTEGLYVITGFNKWGMTNALAGANIISDEICNKDNPYKDVFSPFRSIIHPKLFINTAETLLSLIKPTTPRCPHLGCALKYNKNEHTWDCPCHGSRFQEDGKLIENPATDDLKLNK